MTKLFIDEKGREPCSPPDREN